MLEGRVNGKAIPTEYGGNMAGLWPDSGSAGRFHTNSPGGGDQALPTPVGQAREAGRTVSLP